MRRFVKLLVDSLKKLANELPFHLVRARENGISKDEIVELFTHVVFYTGWPNAMTAVRVANEEPIFVEGKRLLEAQFVRTLLEAQFVRCEI